jgi:hypothetical protein
MARQKIKINNNKQGHGLPDKKAANILVSYGKQPRFCKNDKTEKRVNSLNFPAEAI